MRPHMVYSDHESLGQQSVLWNRLHITSIATQSGAILLAPFALSVISACYMIWGAYLSLLGHNNPENNSLLLDENHELEESSRKESRAIDSLEVARIAGCLSLTGLSLALVALSWPARVEMGLRSYAYVSFLIANFYALVLIAIAIRSFTEPSLRLVCARHANLILFAEFAGCAYRNVWPLATYREHPLDLEYEGWLLWTRLVLLFVCSTLVPLCLPTVYIPLDSRSPAQEFHPEQTASWISYHTYSYLTPVIKAATRVAHLPAEKLPPLADYDAADGLMDRALPYLVLSKGSEGQHILFSLLNFFGREYLKSILGMTIYPLMGLVSPLAINRLLSDLELKGNDEATIRPWVWIALMFAAPILGSMGFQYYTITMSRALANAESILTQLVFEHSLKVRIQGDTLDPSQETGRLFGSTSAVNTSTSSFMGRLTNLATIDLNNIIRARDLVIIFWLTPVQVIGSGLFLYVLLGWSALVGLSLMAILLPITGYMTMFMSGIQREKMKRTDDRTQAVTEAMSVIRMIKMFGWERKMNEKISQKREEELVWVWKGAILALLVSVVNFLIPVFSMLATFATATLIMGVKLTPSTVFSSMILFDTIRDSLGQATKLLNVFVAGKVSIDRLDSFLKDTQLLDKFEPDTISQSLEHGRRLLDADMIGFRNASFTWASLGTSRALDDDSVSSQKFTLKVPGELSFARGKLNLIVGPTGSGKTSLLMALLGEIHFQPTHSDSMFNLPRAGGLAFAVQETWVQNETIRANILFNSPYEEERYAKVVHQCALEQDLDLFEAGDQTEVGERGLTLSGGQRARLTLARAIYSQAEIILLDDILAALDVHTASWIVDKCLKGDLVRDRTVLLVTHNVALTRSIAARVVTLSKDGIATSLEGDIEETMLAEQRPIDAENEGDFKDATCRVNEERTTRKLIVAEEVEEGTVGWRSLKMFFDALGGDHSVFFFTIWTASAIFEFFMHSFNLWFLGYWSSQYEKLPVTDIPVLRNLGIYTGLIMVGATTFIFKGIWFLLAKLRVSRTIHSIVATSILRATFRWLDETPISRITTRMTLDIDNIDGYLSQTTANLQAFIIKTAINLVSAVIFVPVFAWPAIVILILGAWTGRMYLKAQLSVKREMSNAKAPMLAHFEAAMAGLVSIRAYGAENVYRAELRQRIDRYVRISRMNFDLNRWISIRFDILGAVFTASLAAYLTYASSVSAANVGFSLNRAVEFCSILLMVVRWHNVFQLESNSLERIYAYTQIEHEPDWTPNGVPPAAWPTSGKIRATNLSARYSPTGSTVLHKLSFDIAPGERIGIVGRTGSGKSSLTLSLLRCILTEGAVHFDDLRTDEINVDALRSSISIIPQVPELLTGTLRQNLDLFEEYDDVTLNRALQIAGLEPAAHNGQGVNHLTLDSVISSGGRNISVGQRQIIALARAIVRSRKLWILDEATSSIDNQVDAIIQRTLREEIASDVTVLIIAHRLQTVVSLDKVMVLDSGRIVEYAPPSELIKKDKGYFKDLVERSKDRDQLYTGLKTRPSI